MSYLTYLKSPIDVEKLLSSVEEMVLPENVPGKSNKPRASGLANCARQQAYSMHAVPITDKSDYHQAFANEQNRTLEDVTCAAMGIRNMPILNRQISLPADYPVTGHPDGEVGFRFESDVARGFDKETDEEGLKWGFEHKVLGRYSYLDVFKQGLMASKPGYITQAMLYGDALGWDAVLFTVLSADHTSTKGEHTQASRPSRANPEGQAWTHKEGWDAKALIIPIDLRPLAPLLPVMKQRAADLSAVTNPHTVSREYSGTDNFPCNYCNWQKQCVADGDGDVTITKNPI